MKRNPSRTWTITLRDNSRAKSIATSFVGTYDEVLSEADVLECQVDWQVMSITIEAIRKS
jgi:hypothetical protein